MVQMLGKMIQPNGLIQMAMDMAIIVLKEQQTLITSLIILQQQMIVIWMAIPTSGRFITMAPMAQDLY